MQINLLINYFSSMKENVLKTRTKMFLFMELLTKKREQPILLSKILYLNLVVFLDHYNIKLTLCKVQTKIRNNQRLKLNGHTQPVVAIKLR